MFLVFLYSHVVISSKQISGFLFSRRGNLPLHFQESTTSESGSIENVSGNSIIPSVNPLGIAPVLSGSVETFPRTTANPTENDGRDGNRMSESSTNSNITVPEIMRHRAASTGSVLSGRRDSTIKGNDDNRTMVFQVQNIKTFLYCIFCIDINCSTIVTNINSHIL